jgi:hypothetical protein
MRIQAKRGRRGRVVVFALLVAIAIAFFPPPPVDAKPATPGAPGHAHTAAAATYPGD